LLAIARMISTTRRAGLLIAALTLLSPAGTFADSSSADVAREHFKAGVRHLQDPDGARYEDAYREFRAAYAATPSPKILGNIGFCAMKLERDGEAIEAYTRYLAEVSDIDADEREQIVKDLQSMKSGVIRVTVTVKGGGANLGIIDTRTPTSGAPVVNAYPVNGALTIGLHPGRHSLRARAANGDESAAWDLDALPGTQVEHVFTVVHAPVAKASAKSEPASVEERSRAVPWLLTAVGGAALIGGAVTGFIAMNKVSRLESRCPNDVCPAGFGLAAERTSIERYSRATDYLLIGGGVVAATGVVWLLVSGSQPKDGAPRTDVACSTGGCSVLLTGAF
jgi:hypothetical protein